MTTTTSTDAAAAHFAAKLRFETDPSDLAAALAAGEPLTVIDSRGHAAWHQGRIAGAIHLPTAEISARAADLVAQDHPVVVYCWGPGCNGGTKAALAFAELGYDVRELLGGFEYWAREGLAVTDDEGPVIRPADPLTSPVNGALCDC